MSPPPSYEFLRDKSLLITGGSGSFGKAATKILVGTGLPRRVIVFSRDEWKQWEMQNGDPIFRHPSMRYFLGDVRDEMRLRRAFQDVDYVIHAAALKQVPAAEYNPTEFIRTNVTGASNIINAAIDSKVSAVVALSTDKAVNPVNLYGATKLCSDKLFTAAAAYVGRQKVPKFCVVRYGNVLNSRGSILPRWRQLLAEGAPCLPITDVRMTRFWISLEEAVHFVIMALDTSVNSEIFVPKIASMSLVDMAEALAPGIPHDIIGIRPGEKLHETLISSEDGRHTLDCKDYYAIIPETHLSDTGYMEALRHKRGGCLSWTPEDFSYTSDKNDRWLDSQQLRRLLQS